jgi:5,10-methylene-tetrahydrofolate dehydrogenase/methenyl tetrahydrofolate cyclohydrolase
MLKELKKYENLGTPNYFWEFFLLFKDNTIWTDTMIQEYFFNKIIDNKIIHDGTIPLLLNTGIISLSTNQQIIINTYFKNLTYSKKNFQKKLLEGFLNAFQNDKEFIKIFKNTYYDYSVFKSLIIKKSAFGLQYSNLRKLLEVFDFLLPHPNLDNIYVINPEFKKYFKDKITPKIKKELRIDELREKLKQQELDGEKAEKYVLSYETSRLGGKGGIEWISPYDSSAGFDILSYNAQDDKENNRFIEVKSYTGNNPYFYWTKNEISKAKEEGENYVLYIVCKENMNDKTYNPIIITNPIVNVLKNNKWIKEVDKYYIRTSST